MIAGLSGKILSIDEHAVIIDCLGVHYEVLVPVSVAQRLHKIKDHNDKVSLITYHYLQLSQTSAQPMLVGFLHALERDFFLHFISVSGIGPRAAVKALSQSIGDIAQAIDEGNVKYLTSLPGIGMQRAKEIVAKLGGKMGAFALMRDEVVTQKPMLTQDVAQEALTVLLQLQYKKAEAEGMIKDAMSRNDQLLTVEALLNEIYKHRKSPG